MASRRFFVGGNWKLNGKTESIKALVSQINLTKNSATQILVAPPHIYLPLVKSLLRPDIALSAQNCWKDPSGAFTGETSAEQLRDIGVEWVILGHSERRHIFKEDIGVVGQKTGFALKSGLGVIFCCGETLAEREAGETEKVVFAQLEVLKALEAAQWGSVVIAYEPVWAIGTGKVATPEVAQAVHAEIRKYLRENVSESVANQVRIIYGGSVNGKNCVELAKQPDIDGFLVGGASLKGDEFLQIVDSRQ
eukprot:TRINITY_DN117_c0_g2_i1.p2 TRINITY_DN117_c0_g2~~TRINITY_DN117_c0_g2_i1.p2  ORF type:complete len:258 (+),score=42.83 TRINITY_DN117_c0_g2_i1:27-776(+)